MAIGTDRLAGIQQPEFRNTESLIDFRVPVEGFEWQDPYLATRRDRLKCALVDLRINRIMRQIPPEGFDSDDNPLTNRIFGQPAPTVDNPEAREEAALGDWLQLRTTALALRSLQHPELPTIANEARTPVDSKAQNYFKYILDARGIRSRAAAMSQVMQEHFAGRNGSIQWLSLAAGAADPVMGAAKELKSVHGKTVRMTLLDHDERALELVNEVAAENGISPEEIQTGNVNVLHVSRVMEIIGEKEKFDAVDILGFLEYLPTKSRKPDGRLSPVSAQGFLQFAYELVKPGGILVLGNMRDRHPQLPFTLEVVRWPHLHPRSDSELLSVLEDAGIPLSQQRWIQPNDKVYNVVAVTKPIDLTHSD